MKHKKLYENGKYVPQRMCVACRSVKPKSELLRIAVSDGGVAVDRCGGRGAYVCKDKECILKAQKARGLERGLKTFVSSEIYEECMTVV